MTVTLRYSARSDIGLVRQTNQDSGYAGPHLCAMCDGMGGPAGGDIASAIAIEHLAPLDADSHQASEMLGLLREAIQSTHTDLVTLSNQDPDLAGLGTTCVAVMRSGNKLAMVHVGDSRAYLLRDGGLTQVTTDHTFVEYLVSPAASPVSRPAATPSARCSCGSWATPRARSSSTSPSARRSPGTGGCCAPTA